jgi:hypothetical protein
VAGNGRDADAAGRSSRRGDHHHRKQPSLPPLHHPSSCLRRRRRARRSATAAPEHGRQQGMVDKGIAVLARTKPNATRVPIAMLERGINVRRRGRRCHRSTAYYVARQMLISLKNVVDE